MVKRCASNEITGNNAQPDSREGLNCGLNLQKVPAAVEEGLLM